MGLTPAQQDILNEIAFEEQSHVQFQRSVETEVAVSLRGRRIRKRAPTESCPRNRLNRARCSAHSARRYPLSIVY